MARISIQGIVKHYGRLPILKGIELDIVDGEFLTLVGPSGCGKSTTLRIIAGLEKQDSGDVLIDGKNVNAVRPSRRDLAMVFQSYALYPHLTVRENLATPLLLRDLSAWQRLPLVGLFVAGRRARVRALMGVVLETARTLKIEHLLDRKPGQLSGGQRQRVALGRAMVRNPAAFLMDEPLSNLDAGLRVHMRAELAELHRALGTTFIYVTHDQAEALTMSDRLAVMMNGELLQIGRPSEIYNNPNSLRVAEFIGSPKINVLSADVSSDGIISFLGTALMRRTQGPMSAKVFVGIRPEHLVVHRDQSMSSFPGTVVHMENLGSDFYLHVAIESADERIIVSAKPDDVSAVEIGDKVWLGWQPGKPMTFDDDGQRLPFIAHVPSEQVLS